MVFNLYASQDGSYGTTVDPRLAGSDLAPSFGNLSGGVSFGGGAAFGGMGGGAPIAGGTGTITAPRYGGTTAVAPNVVAPQTTTVTTQPVWNPTDPTGGATGILPHPAAPAAPRAVASQTPPPLNQLSSPPASTKTANAPVSTSTATPSNPYAASLTSYQTPVNPLTGAFAAAQLQGQPTQPGPGQAPIVSNGLEGSAPLPSFVPGVGGLHGGMGNLPPMQAAAGPVGPAPFSGLIAYNGNPAQGAGTANRGNLQAQAPTRGQAIQQAPARVTPKPNLVPPPPPTAPTPAQMALMNGAPPAVAMALTTEPPPPTPTQVGMAAMLNKLMKDNYSDNVSLITDLKAQKSALDKRIFDQQDKMTAPARAAVAEFTKPGMGGTASLLEQGYAAQRGANAANSKIQEILDGMHDAEYDRAAQGISAIYADVAKKSAAQVGGAVGAIRQQESRLVGPTVYASQVKALKDRDIAHWDAQAKRLQAQADNIRKQYQEAQGEQIKAFDQASRFAQDMNKAFHDASDMILNTRGKMSDFQKEAVSAYIREQDHQDTVGFQKIQAGLLQKANDLNASKATTDAQQKAAHFVQETVKNLDSAIAAAEKAKKPDKDRIAGLKAEREQWSKQLAGGSQ